MRDNNQGNLIIGVGLRDISNQCESINPCDINATCSQVSSSANPTCECNSGYLGDGFDYCNLVQNLYPNLILKAELI